MKIVHYVAYADQGDLLIKCFDRWTEVAWKKCDTDFPVGVYLAEPLVKGEDHLWYTFTKSKITCPQCLSKVSDSPRIYEAIYDD